MIRTLAVAFSFSVSAATVLVPTIAQAQDVQDVANMSKSDFLAYAEDLSLQGFAAQAELLRRFKPDQVPEMLTAPLSEAELTAMACTWDGMRNNDLLLEYAKQTQLLQTMIDFVAENGEHDIVDYYGNLDILQGTEQVISDDVISVMSDCGTIEASAERSKHLLPMFSSITEEMQKRGYAF
ncbi:MAG: hypothetical protein JXR13_13130 [Thalassovita sp.]